MNLTELKTEHAAGRLQKHQFIEAMHEHHRVLHEYAAALAGTDVERIELAGGEVTMIMSPDGLRFVVDPQDWRTAPVEALNFGRYEGAEGEVLMALAEGARVALDVGANVGFYSMRIARRNPGCTVHAFEPIPRTFGQLERHLALNGIGNVVSNRLGLSDEPGELVFHFYPEGSGNASAANLTGRADVQRLTAPVVTLDAYVAPRQLEVDFVKVDVEGAELLALRGATATLRRDRPALFVELLRKWSAPFGYHPNDVLDLLEGLGYRTFVVTPSGALRSFGRVDEQTAETNYVFLHPSRHEPLWRRLGA